MIYIPALIEKEEVSVAEEKERRADAIEKTDGHEQREKAERNPVNVEPVPRPRMDPGEAVIFKQ